MRSAAAAIAKGSSVVHPPDCQDGSPARRHNAIKPTKATAKYPPAQPFTPADLQAFAVSANALPLVLLVPQEGQAIGTGALKSESVPSHGHLGPWVAAGFVLPAHCGRGVGAFLLQALVARAGEPGHGFVYCGTSTANMLLERSDGQLLDSPVLQGRPLGIYRTAT